MKSPAERGPVGAWAEEARDLADLSVPQVIDALAQKGHHVTDATIRGIEGGSKKPGRKLLRLLGEVYGSRPPGQSEEAPPGDLATAITDLVVELRLWRTEDRDRIAKLEATVGRLAGGVVDLPRTPTPRAPRAPRETAG